jgi:hypothetical protein
MDEAFVLLLPGGESLDREVVRFVSQTAARRFRFNGGARFYPQDRLEEDLHWGDLAPWATEAFWADIEEYLGYKEEELAAEAIEIMTFGDVVLLVDRLRRVWNGK